MGKVRVKTFGDEATEAEEQKKKQARLAESKRAKKEAKRAEKAVGKDVEKQTAEPVIAIPTSREKQSQPEQSTKPAEKKKAKKEKFQKAAGPKHSQKYLSAAMVVDKTKVYPLSEAISLLPQLKTAKFDETVELHINMLQGSLSTNVSLPHGTGKQTRVAIADEQLIADIEKTGKIDFDVLLAAPQMMPKLAKIARILGPKGLMPNPKNDTMTPNPEEAAKKYAGGHMQLKTESKFPILHVAVGKVSFGEKKLQENIKVVLGALAQNEIKNATLKLTMSPGIKLKLD